MYHVNQTSSYSFARTMYGGIDVFHYTNLVQDAKVSCEQKIGKQNATIIRTLVLNGKLTMFLCVAKDKNRKLFVRTYNDSHVPTDSEMSVVEYEGEFDASGVNTFNIVQSKNGEFVAVEYIGVDPNSENAVVGVQVYDKNLKMLSKSVNPTPYISREFTVISRNLSNKGEYYQGVSVYDISVSGKVVYRNSLKETVVTKYTSTENIRLNLNTSSSQITDKMIVAMELNADLKDEIVCSGIYSVKEQAGLFYMQLNFDKKDVLYQKYFDLQPGALEEHWLGMNMHQTDQNRSFGQWYESIGVFRTTAGDMCFVFEQRKSIMSLDSQTHTFSDIIVYKIDKNGEVSWASKANKTLPEYTEGKALGGVSWYHTDTELVFFFNDQYRNYDNSNNYKKVEGSVVVGAGENAVARAVVDLETGEIKRNRVVINGDTQEDNIHCIPESFRVDYETREVYLHFVKKNTESFGVLKF